MNDQASALRESLLRPSATRPSRAQTMVVLSGKGGVGTTTVAVNLAVAMANRVRRVCLLDADTTRFDAAHLVGLSGSHRIPERIHPREQWHGKLPQGSGGISVASATQFFDADPRQNDVSGAQLARRLARHDHGFDAMVVDVGCQPESVVQAWCDVADQILVVMAPDTVAVLNTYALLKRLTARGIPGTLRVVFNQVIDPAQAAACEQRLVESTQRFLGQAIHVAGHIPFDARLRDGYATGVPVVVSSPRVPSARAIEGLADRMVAPIRRPPSNEMMTAKREPVLIYQKNSSQHEVLVEEGKSTVGREIAR